MVQLDKVTKKFTASKTALDNISFTIANGEFVFLVGPSGAGKTTLLRLLTRELLPTLGRVFVDKLDLSKLASSRIPQLRRKVTMVFQDFKVLSYRTVYENVAIALEIQGKDRKTIDEAVRKSLTLVDLDDKIESFPAQLSAGELQRVAIARATVAKPKLLLADEPTGNLDPKTGWDIIKLLTDINKLGATVIVGTHNMDIVNSMKRRVIALRDGRLISDQKEGRYV